MKNRMAAFGAAFLLLGTLFLIPTVRVHAAASFTTLINIWLQNSKIDASPVGATTASTGAFTSLTSTSGALNGTVGATTPSTGVFTAITGPLTGNASTATALAATPTQCASGTVTTGIAASGNSNCTAKAAITGTQVLLPTQSLCTPATSTDSQCTGTVSFAAFPDTAYTVSATTYETSGANLLFTMTAKTTTSISYALTCTFNCGTFNGPAADIRIFHP